MEGPQYFSEAFQNTKGLQEYYLGICFTFYD